MNKFVLLIVVAIISSIANAADVLTHNGRVTSVVAVPHSYGNYAENAQGLLGISVEGLPKGCGDGETRAVISKDHPLHDSALSLAMMALAAGKEVRIAYFNECTVRKESWDFAYILVHD